MRYLLLTAVLLLSLRLAGQGDSTLYDWKIRNSTLENALFELSDLTGIPISFSNTAAEKVRGLTFQFRGRTLEYMLETILQGTGFRYEWLGGQVFVIRYEKQAFQKFSISGYLRDSISGEPLIGATIYSPALKKGTATNDYGYYSLTIQEGTVDLVFSYLGYQPRTLPFELYSNQVINLELSPSVMLEEVIVTAPAISPSHLEWSSGQHENLQEDMKTAPFLNGEPDVIRLAYLLPGVQTGAEGLGGLSVRGGDVDQNLILLDGVPVYHATHLLGAFSVFNSSAVRSAQLIKGIIPARYGGRVSSVLDVRTKEGNNREWVAEADIGIASGKASVEGPVVREKCSVFLGARRSFIDFLSRPYTRRYWEKRGQEGELGYYFYDLNAKINYKLGHNDHLYASFYTGSDDLSNWQLKNGVSGDSAISNLGEASVRWGNAIGSLRWNHLFSKTLFSNTTLTYSRFHYGSKDIYERNVWLEGALAGREYLLFRYNSNNRDLALYTDFDYRPGPAHTIRFGGSAIWHRFQPGTISFDENASADSLTEESQKFLLERTAQYSGEIDLYAEDEFQLSGEFGGNIGLRSTTLRSGGQWLTFLQPRLLFHLRSGPRFHTSIGVSRTIQSLHLLTSSGLGLPRDLWVSATPRIRPIDSWQVSGGIYWNGGKGWTAQLEGFYKSFDHLVTFQEGLLTAIDAVNWQNEVATGRGWAYGAEWMLKRDGKRFSGWMAYTLSYSRRLFEEVNLGESFPYRYDRRHSLHLAGAVAIKKRWKISGSWTFGTGIATTLPLSSYQFNQFNLLYADLPPQFPFVLEVSNYGRKNDVRLPAYHRLDAEVQFEWGEKRVKHQVSLGAYNLYNRFNPLYYILAQEPNSAGEFEPKYKEVALLPLVPTLRYQIRWTVARPKRRW